MLEVKRGTMPVLYDNTFWSVHVTCINAGTEPSKLPRVKRRRLTRAAVLNVEAIQLIRFPLILV
jgi:hypothetical protein